MNTNRRKSLIPRPSLSNIRKESNNFTPANSPQKEDSRRSSLSPISPSKIPLSTSTTGSSVSSNNSRKRGVSSSLDDYLSTLQTHINADVDAERSSLSEILLEIEARLSHYHQLCTKLRDLQKREAKISNTIFEYEIGIPVKQSTLDQEVLKVEKDLERVQEDVESQKSAYVKVIQHKEDKLIDVLQELVNDAERDDDETIRLRSQRLQSLKEEKEELLGKIEVAKVNMDSELEKFKTILSSDKVLKQRHIEEVEKKMDAELQRAEEEHGLLKEDHSSLQSKLEKDHSQIESLEKDVDTKKIRIEELRYRLSDMKSLISELQLDLNNALTLFSSFQNGVYQETKDKWTLAKSRLQEERHKRLKIEIQIREISGIPNIVILETSMSHPLKNTSLCEFFKPSDYDWKSEMLTAVESALEGVSSCVLLINENSKKGTDLRVDIELHLRTIIEKEDRFKNYETIITQLDSLEDTEKKLGTTLESAHLVLPLNTTAVFVTMTNSDTSMTRKSVIFLVYISTISELILDHILNIGETIQCITIAENVSESWLGSLQCLASLKPIRLRKSHSFLNN